MTKKQKKTLKRIIAAAVLTVLLALLFHFVELPWFVQLVLWLVPYLVIGHDVLRKAFVGIKNGEVFDENFLMAVATIGAWAVGSFDEAVGVMLFYRVGEYFEDRAVDRSRKQIMDAIDLRPETVNLVKDNGKIPGVLMHNASKGTLNTTVCALPDDELRRIAADAGVSDEEIETLLATRQPPAVSTPTVQSSCVSPTFSLRAWYSAFSTAWRMQRPASRRSTALSPVFPAFTPRLLLRLPC